MYTLLTRGTSDHAAPPLVFIQMGHLIVGAPQLEAKDWLEVFALEEDFAFETIAEIQSGSQGGLGYDFVDAGGEDQAHVLLIMLVPYVG